MKQALLITAIATLLVLAYVKWPKPKTAPIKTDPTNALSSAKINQTLAATQTIAVTHKPAQLEALQEKLEQSSSARGSHIDRPIMSNAEGQFSLSPSLLFYFDYFLSLRSEFEFKQILQLITEDIKNQYPKNFQPEILRLFIQYADYKMQFANSLEALTEHDMQYLFTLPQQYQAFKQSIQQQFFSQEEIDALFIEYETNLSQPSKAAQKAEQYQQYQKDKAQGITSNVYDAATINRLEQLNQKRQQWQQRLNDYTEQRDVILTNTGLDEFAKKEAVLILQASLFNDIEQRRVQAFDRAQ